MAYKEKRIREFCSQYASEKIKPIVDCDNLSREKVVALMEAAACILEGKRRILNYLVQESSTDDILNMFGVSPWLSGTMEILKNPEWPLPIIRIDAIIDKNGKYWLCEYNIGPSMGGTETAEFGRIDSNGHAFLSPYDCLFAYLDCELKKLSSNKICILVWDQHSADEYFHRSWLLQSVKIRIPGVQVMIADHASALMLIDESTLVYRMFSIDSIEKAKLMQAISLVAGAVHCDCSGYLMESKVWLAMLQKREYQHLLDQKIKNAVQEIIPPTILIDEYNIEYFLKNKDEFFFKQSSSCGGSDVLFGAECQEGLLINRISSNVERKWVAQSACLMPLMSVSVSDRDQPVVGYGVYGFFCINGQWISSGGVLRVGMNNAEHVVNVAKGAVTGWASIKEG